MDIKKSSGLILHPSSLPGEYGIGDLGLNSFNFVDLLKSSKTNIWQVLPLGITDEVEYSPYSSKSSILGNPYLISINDICLLYTSPSPRDATLSRMPSSA